MHASVLLDNKHGWGSLLRKLGMAAVLYGACLASASAAVPEPFIAVILPAKSQSKAFQLAANTVKAGLQAAVKVHGGKASYPLRMFDVGDAEEETLVAFNQAQSQGAVAVIGPLTRSALNYLADMATLSMPVLALNTFDEITLRRTHLYSFGLAIESEVLQVVRMMRRLQVARPVVVTAQGPLSLRMQRAFMDAWRAESGEFPALIEVYDAKSQSQEMQAQLNSADAVFFAMDGRRASMVRPYLPAGIQMYATSQILVGRAVPVDMSGVRYVDMPWMANPDAPEYVDYGRQRTTSGDEERLFAVGVDAWWLAQLLAKKESFAAVDGLTGWLEPLADGVINRELTELLAATYTVPVDANNASAPVATVR